MRGLAVLAAGASCWVIVAGLPVWVERRTVPLPDLVGIGIGTMAAVGSGLIAFLLFDVAAVAVAIGVLVGTVPYAVRHERRRRAGIEVRDRWPDVLMYVRTSLAAGSTLEDATVDAMTKVGEPFDTYAEKVRRETGFGGGFERGMDFVRGELDDATTDTVVTTLVAASRSGGRRVSQTVAALASSTADDLRLRKAHEASLTEQRWTINVALVAPWVLLGLSLVTNPQSKEAFSTSEGAIVIAVGLVATCAGWLLARRTARLSSPPRILR